MFRKLVLMWNENVEDLSEGEYDDMDEWHESHTDRDFDSSIPLDIYVGLDEPLITAKALSEIMLNAETFDIALHSVWAYVHTPVHGYENAMEDLLVVTIDDEAIAYISEHLYEMLAFDPNDPSWTVVPGMVI